MGGFQIGRGLLKAVSALVFCRALIAPAAAAQLVAGPMAGYPAPRSALLWLQTDGPAQVQIAFWPAARPRERSTSMAVSTERAHHHTAHFELAPLVPGTRYEYQVLVDGHAANDLGQFSFRTAPQWQWRAPPPDVKVLTGSCAYFNDADFDRPGRPYGDGYRIYRAMAAQQADQMLWLGDALYLREADYASPAGMAARYRRDRARLELQDFLRSTPQAAIWDDHDYGPNDSGSAFVFKQASLDLFKDYWVNPSYGLPGAPGIYTVLHLGDADFFLLDDRWYRDAGRAPETADKGLFGPAQMAWLKNALLESTARFKIVASGGQLLNPDGRYDAWTHYPAERQAFLAWLKASGVKGVLLLSGDRHLTELLRLERPGAYPLHELTCSPLNSGPAKGERTNGLRLPGTLVEARNFCALHFVGQGRARRLEIASFDVDGRELWRRAISLTELGYD